MAIQRAADAPLERGMTNLISAFARASRSSRDQPVGGPWFTRTSVTST